MLLMRWIITLYFFGFMLLLLISVFPVWRSARSGIRPATVKFFGKECTPQEYMQRLKQLGRCGALIWVLLVLIQLVGVVFLRDRSAFFSVLF